MRSILKVLNDEEILAILKENYKDAEHVELYIEYNDEGVEGNDQIIAEVNLPRDSEVATSNFDAFSKELAAEFKKIRSEEKTNPLISNDPSQDLPKRQ